MCVILIAEDNKPAERMIEDCWHANKDGGGIAWREGGKVKWKKGLTKVDDMIELCDRLPLPYVAHFRIASCGGVLPELTHPFPIHEETHLDLEGETSDYVLFHNGHWSKYQDVALNAAIQSNVPLPAGKWSDTRVMAWLASIYGFGYLELLGIKGVAFGPDNLEVFVGDGWHKIAGVWASNTGFQTKDWRKEGQRQQVAGFSSSNMPCKYGACRQTDNLDKDGYCAAHLGGRPQTNTYPAALPPLQGTKVDDVPPEVKEAAAKMNGYGTGGAQPQTAPFRATAGEFPSLAQAEALYLQKDANGNRLISKNYLKKVRAYHGMHGGWLNPKIATSDLIN